MSSEKEKGKEFIELLNKRKKLEGTRVFFTLLNLSNSNYTVNENYQELSTIICKFEDDLSIWDIKNRNQYNDLTREFLRLLQNYLSSIYSLIEHTYTVCKDLSRFESCEEYNSQVSSLNEKNCIRFVKDLRTYSQHIRLPLISGQLSFGKNKETGQNEIKQKILLNKEKMITWNKWHNNSKSYIESHNEIDLKLVLAEYQALIKAFYDWFYKKGYYLYAKELEEFSKIEAEIARIAP